MILLIQLSFQTDLFAHLDQTSGCLFKADMLVPKMFIIDNIVIAKFIWLNSNQIFIIYP